MSIARSTAKSRILESRQHWMGIVEGQAKGRQRAEKNGIDTVTTKRSYGAFALIHPSERPTCFFLDRGMRSPRSL
jgi:hypothetical protein